MLFKTNQPIFWTICLTLFVSPFSFAKVTKPGEFKQILERLQIHEREPSNDELVSSAHLKHINDLYRAQQIFVKDPNVGLTELILIYDALEKAKLPFLISKQIQQEKEALVSWVMRFDSLDKVMARSNLIKMKSNFDKGALASAAKLRMLGLLCRKKATLTKDTHWSYYSGAVNMILMEDPITAEDELKDFVKNYKSKAAKNPELRAELQNGERWLNGLKQ